MPWLLGGLAKYLTIPCRLNQIMSLLDTFHNSFDLDSDELQILCNDMCYSQSDILFYTEVTSSPVSHLAIKSCHDEVGKSVVLKFLRRLLLLIGTQEHHMVTRSDKLRN